MIVEKLTTPPKKQNTQFTRMTEEQEQAFARRSETQGSSLKSKFVNAGEIKQSDKEAPPTKIVAVHTVTEWRPAKLLCKRFNIRDPYKHLPDVEPTPSTTKGVSSIEEMVPPNEPLKKKNEPVVEVGEIMKEFSDPLQNVKKAEIDLFDELFNV